MIVKGQVRARIAVGLEIPSLFGARLNRTPQRSTDASQIHLRAPDALLDRASRFHPVLGRAQHDCSHLVTQSEAAVRVDGRPVAVPRGALQGG